MKTHLFAYLLSLMIIMTTATSAVQAATTATVQTNLGTFVIELDYAKAPASVENFVRYAQDGFYEGTIFHRVIPDFMVQGGGYTDNFQRKMTRDPIKNEADNGLQNQTGTVAMARTSAPDSATSQFFVNVSDNDFLNYRSSTLLGWGYAVFGKVVNGMDVVEQIENLPTGSLGPFKKDVPLDLVVIEKVTIDNIVPELAAALAGQALPETSDSEVIEPTETAPETTSDGETDETAADEATQDSDTEIATDAASDVDETSTEAATEVETLAAVSGEEAVPAPDSPTPPDPAQPVMR